MDWYWLLCIGYLHKYYYDLLKYFFYFFYLKMIFFRISTFSFIFHVILIWLFQLTHMGMATLHDLSSLHQFNIIVFFAFFTLKLLSKFIRILRIRFCYTQLCGGCLVNMTPVVKVVIHCVFARPGTMHRCTDASRYFIPRYMLSHRHPNIAILCTILQVLYRDIIGDASWLCIAI